MQFEWEPGGLNLLRIITYQINKIGGRIQTANAIQREFKNPIIKKRAVRQKWNLADTEYLLANPDKKAIEIASHLDISIDRVYEKRYKIKKAETLVL